MERDATDEDEDIEYLKHRFFSALKIPHKPTRITPGDCSCRTAELQKTESFYKIKE